VQSGFISRSVHARLHILYAAVTIFATLVNIQTDRQHLISFSNLVNSATDDVYGTNL